jgi:hypothetical protein
MIKDFNVQPEPFKLLQEIIGKSLEDVGMMTFSIEIQLPRK